MVGMVTGLPILGFASRLKLDQRVPADCTIIREIKISYTMSPYWVIG